METTQTHTEPQDDILFDIESAPERANAGRRLANYIIDLIAFYAFLFMVGIAMALVSPETADSFAEDSAGNVFLERIVVLFIYGLFMGAIEALFKGKSIGKWITGTRAVMEDGSPISTKTAFLRGLSRAVPFNAFSALGGGGYPNPWHDRWNNSIVTIERKLN
jgi:uncharacterized RDD family membrane protein YckC